MEPIPTEREPRLADLAGIRAVVCDVYGTLFISDSGEVGTAKAEVCEQALVGAMGTLGIGFDGDASTAVERLNSVIRAWHEQSRRQGVEFPEVDIVEIWHEVLEELAKRDRLLADAVGAIELHWLALEYEVRVNPVWPMPGLRACLGQLRDRGLVLGLISNAQFFTPELFPALLHKPAEHWGFDPKLQFFSYQYGRAKPGEELFRRALRVLENRGVRPENTLYVGNDMLNDICPAHKLGFRTALFAGDQRSLRLREGDPRVEGLEPDLEVTDLRQLPPCLVG
jgi:putative hydrolase of the HAD superfamily